MNLFGDKVLLKKCLIVMVFSFFVCGEPLFASCHDLTAHEAWNHNYFYTVSGDYVDDCRWGSTCTANKCSDLAPYCSTPNSTYKKAAYSSVWFGGFYNPNQSEDFCTNPYNNGNCGDVGITNTNVLMYASWYCTTLAEADSVQNAQCANSDSLYKNSKSCFLSAKAANAYVDSIKGSYDIAPGMSFTSSISSYGVPACGTTYYCAYVYLDFCGSEFEKANTQKKKSECCKANYAPGNNSCVSPMALGGTGGFSTSGYLSSNFCSETYGSAATSKFCRDSVSGESSSSSTERVSSSSEDEGSSSSMQIASSSSEGEESSSSMEIESSSSELVSSSSMETISSSSENWESSSSADAGSVSSSGGDFGESSSSGSEEIDSSDASSSSSASGIKSRCPDCEINVRSADAVYTSDQIFNSGLDNMEEGKCYSLNPDRGTQYGWISNDAQDSWWWVKTPCEDNETDETCPEGSILSKHSSTDSTIDESFQNSTEKQPLQVKVYYDALGRMISHSMTFNTKKLLFIRQQQIKQNDPVLSDYTANFLMKTIDGFVDADHAVEIQITAIDESISDPQMNIVSFNYELITKIVRIVDQHEPLLIRHEQKHKEIYDTYGNRSWKDWLLVNQCHSKKFICKKIKSQILPDIQNQIHTMIQYQNDWDDEDKNNVSDARLNEKKIMATLKKKLNKETECEFP